MKACKPIVLRNGQEIEIGQYETSDIGALVNYLLALSAETRSRFGPHPFDKDTVSALYKYPSPLMGFIARIKGQQKIIAYAVLKVGLLDHDLQRLQQYGFQPDPMHDFTFAPSVADAWQGAGAGTSVLSYIVDVLKHVEKPRLILWGGVQVSNHRAIWYYQKNGFTTLGRFENNGWNYDMALEISNTSPGLDIIG
jgi:diamine N-acetyltransferase